jgi:hypothetical protein
MAMINHDMDATRARQCISAICKQIRILEKQDGAEYEVAMLRAKMQDLHNELTAYALYVYFGILEI